MLVKQLLPLAVAAALSVPASAFAQFAVPPSPSTGSTAPPSKRSVAKPTLTVAVASVTLGDECSYDLAPPPSTKTAASNETVQDSQEPATVQRAARARQPCVQSAIVLKFTSKSKSSQVIEVANVELLDAQGNLLGNMTARNPMQWKASKRNYSYQPWDLKLARGKSVQARWWLSAPPFKSPRGVQTNAIGGYRVSVTVVVDGQETKVSGTVNNVQVMSPPAILEPGMVT